MIIEKHFGFYAIVRREEGYEDPPVEILIALCTDREVAESIVNAFDAKSVLSSRVRELESQVRREKARVKTWRDGYDGLRRKVEELEKGGE